MPTDQATVEQAIEKHIIPLEPYYLPVGKEVGLFEAAYRGKLPVMLKGPTGCGKTRFIEYMAWRLNRPLVTVACHEHLSARALRRPIDAIACLPRAVSEQRHSSSPRMRGCDQQSDYRRH